MKHCPHPDWLRRGGNGCSECTNYRRTCRRRGINTTGLEWFGPARRRPIPRIGYKPHYLVSDLTILQYYADGYTTNQIALKIGITNRGTMDARIMKMLRRFDAKGSCPHAVATALRLGLIQPDRTYRRQRAKVMRKYPVVRYLRERLTPQFHGAPAGVTRRDDYPALNLLGAHTPAHAVSILWAAGKITRSDVPRKDCPR